jgi:mitochondrial splicing suppressor protein 51
MDIQGTPAKGFGVSSLKGLFWSFVQWGFLVVNALRLFASTLVLSQSHPLRNPCLFVQKQDTTARHDRETSHPLLVSQVSNMVPLEIPIADFKLWSCVANLLELDARMPWLHGALSMLQWTAIRGPGRLAGYNGIVDR